MLPSKLTIADNKVFGDDACVTGDVTSSSAADSHPGVRDDCIQPKNIYSCVLMIMLVIGPNNMKAELETFDVKRQQKDRSQ